MSAFPTLKVSNNIVLNKNKPFPAYILDYKALYIIEKTLDIYCNICASKHQNKILAVKLAFFEDDQINKCAYCKKVF